MAEEILWIAGGMRVLPMGWSHSVYIAQNIHQKVVSSATSFSEAAAISPGTSQEIRGVRHGTYIDDFVGLSHEKDLLERS